MQPDIVDPVQRFAESFEMPDPYEAMRHACGELRLNANQLRPPIGLKAIRTHLRAVEITEPMRARGLMSITPTGFEIRVSSVAGWRRARFTIAHEIAHIVVVQALANDPAALDALFAEEHSRAVESLCNAGAEELLIPSEDLLANLMCQDFSPEGLGALYTRYRVSWDMLLIAIAEVLSGAITVWSWDVRPEDEDVARVVQTYGDWGRRTWLPKGLSARSLSSDLVGRAQRVGGLSSEAMLCAGLDDREVWGRALASEIPVSGLEPPRLPLGILRAGDEAPPGKVALLLLDQTDEKTWSLLRGKSQLRFPVAAMA